MHPTAIDGRTRHYGAFFGLDPLPDADLLAIVIGNCQAESVRLLLDGDDVGTVRVPPVHELAADDIPRLHALLRRCDLVIAQPIRDGYHGLPLGTGEVFAVASGARTAVFPVIRFAGLHPWQAIVRPPADPGLVPPVVPYHDLRTLAEVAGVHLPAVDGSMIRAIGAASIDELGRRERRHGAVVVSDLFARPSFEQVRTINHPGNPVLTALVARIRASLGLDVREPAVDRPLLDSVHAPREQAVIDAWGLDAVPVDHWTLDGVAIGHDEVVEAHRRWYREHPDVVDAGLARHRATLELLAGR
ncbi:MAG: peptide ABC transporter ATPase [Williamsia herbipolensis]|nr:peptide ABC transporter ATPase [Williamsia herbipolensis]